MGRFSVRGMIVGAALLVAVLPLAASAGEYAGDFLTRPALTGDWGGARDDALAKGVRVDASVTQVYQGVLDGGKDGSWEYGGRANLTTQLDTQKAGLWPGGFFKLEFEGNWTESANGHTGAIMPVNTNQLFPVPTGDNVGLPEISFAQFVSPYAGMFVGKLDTLAGDANAFAHGKGDTQFFNLAMNLNPVAMVVPYSTLGAGVIVLPTANPDAAIVKFSVLSASGKATTAGFDDISGDNLIFAGEGRVRTGFFDHTGHHLIGVLYSNAEYKSVDQRFGFVVENRQLARSRDTWAVYYNFDQMLYELEPSPGHGGGNSAERGIGNSAERGIGVFGRFGAAEGNPNPVQYFGSIGLGGQGVFADRPLDRFGAGVYYSNVNNLTFEGPFTDRSFLGDEWGFEVFYNIAIRPWMLITPDLQVIEPSQRERLVSPGRREDVKVATVLGVRLQLLF